MANDKYFLKQKYIVPDKIHWGRQRDFKVLKKEYVIFLIVYKGSQGKIA